MLAYTFDHVPHIGQKMDNIGITAHGLFADQASRTSHYFGCEKIAQNRCLTSQKENSFDVFLQTRVIHRKNLGFLPAITDENGMTSQIDADGNNVLGAFADCFILLVF